MAGLTLYDTYIVTYSKTLTALEQILTKAEAHAKENGKDVDADYAGASIHEDMKPLTFQVQTLSNLIKLPISSLTGAEPEPWADDEKTFADLHARIKKTRDLIDSVKPEQINGREEEVVKLAGSKISAFQNGVKAKDIFAGISQPNVFFHLVTAYDILRKQGVPLGKLDYLSPFLPSPAQ